MPLSPHVQDQVPPVINRFNAFAFGIHVLNGGRPFVPFCDLDSDDYVMEWFWRSNKKESGVVWTKDDVLLYVQLFRECWHGEAMNRPSFTQLLNRLDPLLRKCQY